MCIFFLECWCDLIKKKKNGIKTEKITVESFQRKRSVGAWKESHENSFYIEATINNNSILCWGDQYYDIFLRRRFCSQMHVFNEEK